MLLDPVEYISTKFTNLTNLCQPTDEEMQKASRLLRVAAAISAIGCFSLFSHAWVPLAGFSLLCHFTYQNLIANEKQREALEEEKNKAIQELEQVKESYGVKTQQLHEVIKNLEKHVSLEIPVAKIEQSATTLTQNASDLHDSVNDAKQLNESLNEVLVDFQNSAHDLAKLVKENQLLTNGFRAIKQTFSKGCTNITHMVY